MSNPSRQDDVRASSSGFPPVDEISQRHRKLGGESKIGKRATVRVGVYLRDVEALLWQVDRYAMLIASIEDALDDGERRRREAVKLAQELHIVASALVQPRTLSAVVALAETFRQVADRLRAAERGETDAGHVRIRIGAAATLLAGLGSSLPDDIRQRAQAALDTAEGWLDDLPGGDSR